MTDLLRIADRDLTDARFRQLSADRRFATAYNACLTLATMALPAAGFRSVGTGHHWVTLRALPEIMGTQAQARADYLDACRAKRNLTEYDRAGALSHAEADELVQEAEGFKEDLLLWLSKTHPELLPK